MGISPATAGHDAAVKVRNGVRGRLAALLWTAAELRFANGLSFLARFDGDLGHGSRTYAGTGTLRYTW